MSILNIHVGAQGGYALVGVDTHMGPKPAHGSKIMPFVHAHAVLACRGNLFFLMVLWGILADTGADDIEALAHQMPGCIGKAREQSAAAMQMQNCGDQVEDALGEFNVALLGWSHKHSRIQAHLYIRERDKPAIHGEEILGEILAPALGTVRAPAAMPNALTMRHVAGLQLKRVNSELPDLKSIGGRFVVATIDRGGIRFDLAQDLLGAPQDLFRG